MVSDEAISSYRGDCFGRRYDYGSPLPFGPSLSADTALAMTLVIHKINRPPHERWAIGLTVPIRQLARLRPTIRPIVIVIIIVVIGLKQGFHNGGIIAQS